MKSTKVIGIFILTFLVYHFIGCTIYPVDENNYLQAPDWYAPVGIAISIIITVVVFRMSKPGKRHKSPSNSVAPSDDHTSMVLDTPPFRIPLSQKKRETLAEDFLITAKLAASSASKTTFVSTFVEEWDNLITALKNLTWLEGKVKSMHGSPSADIRQLNSEFQWKLRDAIERAANKALSDITGTYRNSKEHKKRRANSFIYDIDEVRCRFSEETCEFADESIKKVRQAAGLLASEKKSADPLHDFSYFGGIEAELLSIDLMEGHDFEYWCGDLLRKLGFYDVEVTPGSGDQGVDILAQKDGIRYAIQCKCYSSDLGNTPIQEVHSGKEFYHCQVGAVITNRFFTAGAKELACATGTLLWDREWITKALAQKPSLNEIITDCESRKQPVSRHNKSGNSIKEINSRDFPYSQSI